jgi:hypothetical protein
MEKCFHIKMVITENMAEKRWKIHPCIIQYAVNWTSAESSRLESERGWLAREATDPALAAYHDRRTHTHVPRMEWWRFFTFVSLRLSKLLLRPDSFLSNLFANYFALGENNNSPEQRRQGLIPAPVLFLFSFAAARERGARGACIKHDKL